MQSKCEVVECILQQHMHAHTMWFVPLTLQYCTHLHCVIPTWSDEISSHKW